MALVIIARFTIANDVESGREKPLDRNIDVTSKYYWVYLLGIIINFSKAFHIYLER